MSETPNSWRRELSVIALALLLLVGVEAVLSQIRGSLSGDIRHLDEAATLVDEVVAAPGLRVLLWGNSLVGEGVDPDQLAAGLSRQLGREVHVRMIRPDGTTPLEWSYLTQRILLDRDDLPDALVVGFGPGHLGDRPAEQQVLRLAMHHVAGSDIGRLFREELRGIEARSQFLLARVSSAFGLRDRISSRVLAALIPSYRELSPILLRRQGGDDAAPHVPTYRHLDSWLDALQQRDLALAAVPMPAVEAYGVAPEAARRLARADATLLDLNPVAGIETRHFYDGEHLDAEGRERFTTALTAALADWLRR